MFVLPYFYNIEAFVFLVPPAVCLFVAMSALLRLDKTNNNHLNENDVFSDENPFTKRTSIIVNKVVLFIAVILFCITVFFSVYFWSLGSNWTN